MLRIPRPRILPHHLTPSTLQHRKSQESTPRLCTLTLPRLPFVFCQIHLQLRGWLLHLDLRPGRIRRASCSPTDCDCNFRLRVDHDGELREDGDRLEGPRAREYELRHETVGGTGEVICAVAQGTEKDKHVVLVVDLQAELQVGEQGEDMYEGEVLQRENVESVAEDVEFDVF